MRGQRKMIRQKQGCSVQKTTMKWKRSQHVTDSHATGVVASTESKMEKSSKPGSKDLSDSPFGLKMVGKKVLVKEEPLELTPDVGTGLTPEVVEMIKGGKLCLPDEGKYALEKFPFKGTVLSVGGQCKQIKVGDRVHFARLGVQRFQFKGEQFLVMHEDDVHGTYESIS